MEQEINMKSDKPIAGFTMVELMIAVAIIRIIATIAIQKWREYQTSSRDNIRKTILIQLSKALQLYYINRLSYPITTGSSYWGYSSDHCGKGFTGSDGYISGLAPRFINVLPEDPLMNVSDCNNCGYLYKSDGLSYKLFSYTADGKVGGAENLPASGEPLRYTSWSFKDSNNGV